MGLLEDREEFFATVRQSLGRSPGDVPVPPPATRLSSTKEALEQRVREVRTRCQLKAYELALRLAESAAKSRWQVFQASSEKDAVGYISALATKMKAHLVVRSGHAVLERLPLEESLSAAGVPVKRAFQAGRQSAEERVALRQAMISAEIGVTGVDYAIAETGTCVLIPRKGVSRLVSLLPPVHVAIVEKWQILETPDDLFTLRRWDFVEKGDPGSYMNFITGPSRTADIEQTMTVGVHGPKEVHMVILG